MILTDKPGRDAPRLVLGYEAMKIAAYGTLLSALAFGVSPFTKTPEVLQYGALSILGWMVWYLLARAFPAHVKAQERERAAYLAAQQEERRSYLEAQAETRGDFRESLAGMAHSLDCMAIAISESRRRG